MPHVSREKAILRYEDSAERLTVTGWCCKTCRRFWGEDEHMARYCCANDRPCECGGRVEPHWACCKDCRRKQRDASWAALPRVEWDGETPLCVWDDDRYFFSQDDVVYYAESLMDKGVDPLSIRLVLCEPAAPPNFDMTDFLQDVLPDDSDAPAGYEAVEKTVNDWIKSKSPLSWFASDKAVSEESLRQMFAGIERTD